MRGATAPSRLWSGRCNGRCTVRIPVSLSSRHTPKPAPSRGRPLPEVRRVRKHYGAALPTEPASSTALCPALRVSFSVAAGATQGRPAPYIKASMQHHLEAMSRWGWPALPRRFPPHYPHWWACSHRCALRRPRTTAPPHTASVACSQHAACHTASVACLQLLDRTPLARWPPSTHAGC